MASLRCFCRKTSKTENLGTHGDWELAVVDAFVAVCGDEKAALRVACTLVATLKNPEASAKAIAPETTSPRVQSPLLL
jgi:hypothetical protein